MQSSIKGLAGMTISVEVEQSAASMKSRIHGHEEDQPLLLSGKKGYTRRQLFMLMCTAYGNFWVAACVSLQAPFFPNEAEQKGASPTIYGLIFGVYELMIITMSPLFGKMVSKMSPNILVQMGLLVCGSATVAFGFVPALRLVP